MLPSSTNRGFYQSSSTNGVIRLQLLQLRSFPGLSTAYHLHRVDRDSDAEEDWNGGYHSHTIVMITVMIVMINVMLLTTAIYYSDGDSDGEE